MHHRNNVYLEHFGFIVPVSFEERPAAAETRIIHQHIDRNCGFL